jgi:RNA polymerase sigma-70 factor (ECF subfamily)
VTAGLAGHSQTDATVLGQSLADPERFAVIFERYFSQIRQYLSRRVGTKIADDLAAEVFVVAFAERQRYDLARDCARPWLYGIATNLAGSHRRREERHYRALARAGTRLVTFGDEDVIAERVSASAAGPALAAALAALDRGDRDVLLLVALADLSYAEVAQSLGIPYGTVCSRLSRARRRLRDSLGGEAGRDHESDPMNEPNPAQRIH